MAFLLQSLNKIKHDENKLSFRLSRAFLIFGHPYHVSHKPATFFQNDKRAKSLNHLSWVHPHWSYRYLYCEQFFKNKIYYESNFFRFPSFYWICAFGFAVWHKREAMIENSSVKCKCTCGID